MGTKNKPSSFDCYTNAEPDEPMFVLLGRDRHAPTLVWLWSALRELDGEDAAVVAEARSCVAEMMSWAGDHDRRVVGLGQAALAGVFDLIRAVNGAAKRLADNPSNQATDIEIMRMFLAETRFEQTAPGADAMPTARAIDYLAEAANGSEYSWLVEIPHGGVILSDGSNRTNSAYLARRKIKRGGHTISELFWTDSPQEAIRHSREQDAAALIDCLATIDSGAFPNILHARPVQHCWEVSPATNHP